MMTAPSQRRASRAFVAFGLVFGAGFLLLPRGTIGQGVVFASAAAASVAAVGTAIRRFSLGRIWRILLAGCVVYWFAVVAWYFYPFVSQRALPYPSVIDLFFFAAYTLWAIFLVGLDRVRGGVDRARSLDGVIAAAGLAAPMWLFFFEPVLHVTSVTTPARLTGIGYASFLLVLAAMSAKLALNLGWGAPAFLLLWITAELAADIVYSLRAASGAFTYGEPWQVIWIVSYAALVAASLHPSLPAVASDSDPAPSPKRLAPLVAPAFALVVATATAVLAIGRSHTVDAIGLVVLAGFISLLVLIRLSGLLVDVATARRTSMELIRLNDQLQDQATHDFLTELPNRRLLSERLEQGLASGDGPTGCLLLDLDNFKGINDLFGHSAGDELLVVLARRLQHAVRPKDIVGRLGGDEFFVILDNADRSEATRLADRLLRELEQPVAVAGRQILARASVGIAVGYRGESGDELLKWADIAMYTSKQRGGHISTVFDAALEEIAVTKHQIEMDLRLAVRNDELRLHYQPVVHLTTGEVVGVEALVRWQHPQMGLVPPDRFIPVAEATGEIDVIGLWVLNEAIRQVVEWDDHGVALDLAINLSPVQLERDGSTLRIASTLAEARIRPGRVTLEFTESAIMKDPDQSIAVLLALKDSGVKIAVDDFGTGYSSLGYLRKLPVDVVKIDRSFVAGIANEAEEFNLAALIINLTRSLGKTSVAEGIELAEHVAHLRAMNCELGQGYFFSRPLPPERLEPLLGSPISSWA